MIDFVKIVEPLESWKRNAYIKSLNRKKKEFNKNEILEKLKEIREKSIENWEKLEREFEKNIKKKGIKLFFAKKSKEASDYIYKIADNKKFYVNKSIVIDELREEIENKGLQIIDTYQKELNFDGEVIIKNYWELADVPPNILWDSFGIRKKNENNFESDYDGIGLLGASCVSANDCKIFFFQHSTNISKVMETLDKIIIVVAIDKIVENSSQAYFQTKCTALFGIDNILYELFNFPPKIEKNLNKSTKNKKVEEKKKKLKDIYIIILDNGRSKVINSKFKKLSYCISCKACRSACPLQNSMRKKNRKELSGKEIIFSSITENLECGVDKGLYECTLCENCKNLCPLKIPIPQFIVEFRNYLSNLMPDVHKNICKNITEFSNPFREENEKRNMFYKKEYEKKKNSNLLFFGCVASFQRGKIVSSATKILDNLGIDYFVLGKEERCCGYPSYIAGSNKFENIVKNNVAKFNNLKPKLILTTCAGCIKTFRNLYPKFANLKAKQMHIVEYLAILISKGKLEFNKEFRKRIAYHDPCDLGRALKIYEEPRIILNSIPGVELIEFPKNRENARCCGAGGGLKAYDDELSKEIGKERLKEAIENNIDVVVSACPACAMNLQHSSMKMRGEKNLKIKIMDITEVIAKAIK